MVLVPFFLVSKLTLSALAAVVFLGACSSSNSNEYQSFCDLSIRMDAASAGPHGQDPGAITDPERMKELRATITALAIEMRDQSPADIKKDVATMVDSIIAMDKVFSDNNYDLTAMARIEEVRNTLDAISTDQKVVDAKQRYGAFMEKNCGPLSQ
jgi:protein-tyrosine-phosphatase